MQNSTTDTPPDYSILNTGNSITALRSEKDRVAIIQMLQKQQQARYAKALAYFKDIV